MKKIIKRILSIILLIVVLIIITLSIPSIQTFIANKVTKKVNEDFGTEIHIDRLGLNWKGEVDIREIYIEDHHGDTLIYAKALQTNILSIKNLVEGDLIMLTIDTPVERPAELIVFKSIQTTCETVTNDDGDRKSVV